MHLWGPRVMLGCRSREDYARRQAQSVAAYRDRFEDGRRVHDGLEPVVAYVNHGRWVADCVECAGGMAVDVHHGEARCFDCGAVYLSAQGRLVLPSDERTAWLDAVLGARPDVYTRNWMPGESWAAIAAENRRNRLPDGKDAV